MEKKFEQKYFCIHCKKEYSSKSGLWYHNTKPCLKLSKFNCKFCNQEFNNRQNKWKHEKICQENKEIIEYKTLSKNKNISITNNNSNNNITNTVNNIVNININPVGNEDLNCLTYEDIKYIFKEEHNCLTKLIELLNFNEKHPENHNFCNTSLEGKYVNVMNMKSNKVEKQNKRDFFDYVLVTALNKMEIIYYKIRNTLTNEKANDLKKLINETRDLHIVNKIATKAAKTHINQISYNNKDMIQNTWNNVDADLIEDKKNYDKKVYDSDTDTDTSDSSTDSFYAISLNKLNKKKF
jgi:hypothetical protein